MFILFLKMICEYCGASLKRLGKNVIEHVNVSQPQQRHQFCSLICKESWCLQVQNKKCRLFVMWCIGSYVGRYFFLKRLIRVRSPSLLGSMANKSYFKSNLHEIKSLKLVDLNGKKILKVEN